MKEENVLNKIIEKQNSTINAIQKSEDLKTESRQVICHRSFILLLLIFLPNSKLFIELYG